MANLDTASALVRYAPLKGTTTKISFTAVSSAWASINSGPSPRYYTLSATQYCYVVFGPSATTAAANTDFLLPPGVHDFVVMPGHGVRVISDGVDGVLCLTPSGV